MYNVLVLFAYDCEQVTLPPGAPAGVSATQVVTIGSRSMCVAWSPNAVASPLYQLRQCSSFSSAAGSCTLEPPSPTAATAYTLTSLVPYTLYTLSVLASNPYGTTVSSPTAVHTVEEAPQQVQTPWVVNASAHEAALCWQPPLTLNGLLTGYALSASRLYSLKYCAPPYLQPTIQASLSYTRVSYTRTCIQERSYIGIYAQQIGRWVET